LFENRGGIKAAHSAQDVHQVGDGEQLPVPRLPQAQDRLGGARTGGEEGDVPVDVETLRQQSPVVPLRVRRVEQLRQRVEHRLRQPEASRLERRYGVVVGEMQQPLLLLDRRLA